MKKLKLFPKTFIYTLSFMLIIILLSHTLIYFLMPKVYNYQQKRELEKEITSLLQQITETPDEERLSLVADFASKWNANIIVGYDGYSYEMDILGNYAGIHTSSQTGKVDATIIADGSDSGIKISLAENPRGGADYFHVEKIFSDGNGYISAVVSRQQIEDAVNVIVMILPFTAILCTIISIVFALYYSRTLTKPIKQISEATELMQNLQADTCCESNSYDEIGQLANNVNMLYQSLLRTIKELEHEIRKVEEAEEQKIDFLRAASHELKTPVTAVNAMLENMLLNIGKYKDRDTYLAKCKELTERLSNMIKEILEASKLDIYGHKELAEADITEIIKLAMKPYQIIAKAKGARFDIDLSNPIEKQFVGRTFEKVISNLLSNAVAYTPQGGVIYIYFEKQQLVIENECKVIPAEHLSHIFEAFYRPDYGRNRASGGNGIGLYIVSSILKSLNINYEFAPSDKIDGMSFRIIF